MKRKLHPVFEGINPEELEQPVEESPWRKPLIYLVGVFMLVLLVSLSFSDVFQGVVQSKSVRQNALYFPNSTILLTVSQIMTLITCLLQKN